MNVLKSAGRVPVGTLGLILLSALAGCGSSKPALVIPDPSQPQGLPTPSAPGPVNVYAGVQSPGTWTLKLDDTQKIFSYQPVTYPYLPNSPVSGSFAQINGFLKLTSNSTVAGYALEVPGRIAILRPGSVNTSPVIGVPQTSCYSMVGRARFQFVAIPAGLAGILTSSPTFGNGSIVASTDSTGANWQFQDLQGNVVAGPASFTGACSNASSQSSIGFRAMQTVFSNEWAGLAATIPTPNTQSVLSIGPSGFFVADQSDSTASQPTGASVAGVVEPGSSLSTADVSSHSYVGFLYQGPTTIGLNGVAPTAAVTSPVSFGASSGVLAGGDFPNDDISQAPNSDMSIKLGAEDGTYNGLYSKVLITVTDPAQNCANYTGSGETVTIGVNALGYPTCTFSGFAVVGNPEGKYAIFLSAYDWAARLGGAPLQFYLFQQ